MQYEDKDRLNKLEKKLYSRNAPAVNVGRSDFNKTSGFNESETPKQDWDNVKNNTFDELARKMTNVAQTKHSIVKKFFVFSLAFFLVALGVAAFILFGGVNQISSRNVDIKVVGPLSIPGGQEVSFDINIINKNNVDLEAVSLLVAYPEGTRSAVDLSKELNEERFSLNKIKSGESNSKNIKAVFFGDKEEVKPVKISLEYRVENSSALFYKEKTHDLVISSAPVIITATYPKEINSNQEISLSLEVVSNSKDKINDLLISAEYPFGFIFDSALPVANFGNNVWQFSTLEPGEKKNIVIKGNMIGQNDEEKVFKIKAGSGGGDDERIITVPFVELMESVTIKKSFIDLNILVGGQSGNYSGRGGEKVTTKFVLKNNLPSRLYNISAEVHFKGGAFDESSISADNEGFFQSINDTILWDKRSVSNFADFGPGEEKELGFQLTPLLYNQITKGVKPEIEVTIKVRGERISDDGSSEEINVLEIRKIMLGTDLVLQSKIVRSQGNLENSGPIPPKPDMPTTYTVVWNLTNSFNQVSNVEVKAVLPSYVKWTNLKSPSAEIFSYNQNTNEVVWNVGSVLPNTGFSSNKKEISFQIEFLPSTSQIGQTPVLVGDVYVYGLDKITGQKIEYKISGLTTNFSGDPIFKYGDDKVTP